LAHYVKTLHDVIHKTGNTLTIVLSPENDQAPTTGQHVQKISRNLDVGFETCKWSETHRQTYKNKQCNTLQLQPFWGTK